MFENEDYEPPTRRRLMLKCNKHAKWEEAEQDELRSSFHLYKVLSKTLPIPGEVKTLPLKWINIYKLKKDLRNVILRHKARLVSQGFIPNIWN